MSEEIPIVRGYTFSKNKYHNTELNFLISMGIINVEEIKKVRCPRCEEEFEYSISSYQLPICQKCGKRVFISEKNVVTKMRIRSVNYSKILRCTYNLLNNIVPAEIDKERTLIRLRYDDEFIYIIFPEISNYNYVIHENKGKNCLFIYLDRRRIYSKLKLWEKRTFYLVDFLKLKHSKIKTLIELVSKDISVLPSENAENWFNSLVNQWKEKERPYKFEKFVTNLVSKLRKALPEYLEALNFKYENTLFNSKVVKIGGPGVQDFHIINLHNYLSNGFKPDKYGETKAYFKSKFTLNDYSEGLMHAKEGEGDLLMITSTNDIQPGIWKKIIDVWERKGYYKHVLIDRELLLLLISLVLEKYPCNFAIHSSNV